MQCRRQDQAGRDGREQDPRADQPPAGRRLGARSGPVGLLRIRELQPTPGDKQQQHAIAEAPQPALLADGEEWLGQQRIGDQAAETAEIRSGVERIRVAAARQREPTLQQRGLRRHDEKQRPDRQQQQPRHPQKRIGIRGQISRHQADGKRQPGKEQQGEVDQSLPRRRKAAEPVGICVAGQEQRLIDQHRRVPDTRRTPQPGQRHARDHRLDEEEQE